MTERIPQNILDSHIRNLPDVFDFAYRNGYHEHGVDIPAELGAAIAELTELRAQAGGWVACSGRMPGEMEGALVVYDGDQIGTAFHVDGKWYDDRKDSSDGEHLFIGDVSHWMPLPNPPEATDG